MSESASNSVQQPGRQGSSREAQLTPTSNSVIQQPPQFEPGDSNQQQQGDKIDQLLSLLGNYATGSDYQGSGNQQPPVPPTSNTANQQAPPFPIGNTRNGFMSNIGASSAAGTNLPFIASKGGASSSSLTSNVKGGASSASTTKWNHQKGNGPKWNHQVAQNETGGPKRNHQVNRNENGGPRWNHQVAQNEKGGPKWNHQVRQTPYASNGKPESPKGNMQRASYAPFFSKRGKDYTQGKDANQDGSMPNYKGANTKVGKGTKSRHDPTDIYDPIFNPRSPSKGDESHNSSRMSHAFPTSTPRRRPLPIANESRQGYEAKDVPIVVIQGNSPLHTQSPGMFTERISQLDLNLLEDKKTKEERAKEMKRQTALLDENIERLAGGIEEIPDPIYISSTKGRDTMGDGTRDFPFKTMEFATQLVQDRLSRFLENPDLRLNTPQSCIVMACDPVICGQNKCMANDITKTKKSMGIIMQDGKANKNLPIQIDRVLVKQKKEEERKELRKTEKIQRTTEKIQRTTEKIQRTTEKIERELARVKEKERKLKEMQGVLTSLKVGNPKETNTSPKSDLKSGSPESSSIHLTSAEPSPKGTPRAETPVADYLPDTPPRAETARMTSSTPAAASMKPSSTASPSVLKLTSFPSFGRESKIDPNSGVVVPPADDSEDEELRCNNRICPRHNANIHWKTRGIWNAGTEQWDFNERSMRNVCCFPNCTVLYCSAHQFLLKECYECKRRVGRSGNTLPNNNAGPIAGNLHESVDLSINPDGSYRGGGRKDFVGLIRPGENPILALISPRGVIAANPEKFQATGGAINQIEKDSILKSNAALLHREMENVKQSILADMHCKFYCVRHRQQCKQLVIEEMRFKVNGRWYRDDSLPKNRIPCNKILCYACFEDHECAPVLVKEISTAYYDQLQKTNITEDISNMNLTEREIVEKMLAVEKNASGLRSLVAQKRIEKKLLQQTVETSFERMLREGKLEELDEHGNVIVLGGKPSPNEDADIVVLGGNASPIDDANDVEMVVKTNDGKMIDGKTTALAATFIAMGSSTHPKSAVNFPPRTSVASSSTASTAAMTRTSVSSTSTSRPSNISTGGVSSSSRASVGTVPVSDAVEARRKAIIEASKKVMDKKQVVKSDNQKTFKALLKESMNAGRPKKERQTKKNQSKIFSKGLSPGLVIKRPDPNAVGKPPSDAKTAKTTTATGPTSSAAGKMSTGVGGATSSAAGKTTTGIGVKSSTAGKISTGAGATSSVGMQKSGTASKKAN